MELTVSQIKQQDKNLLETGNMENFTPQIMCIKHFNIFFYERSKCKFR